MKGIKRAATGKSSSQFSKMMRPECPATLSSERIFQLLDAACQSFTLLFVWGPPGSGKTAHLSSYITKRKIPHGLASLSYSQGSFAQLEMLLPELRGTLKCKDVPPILLMTVYWITASICNMMSLYKQGEQIITEGLRTAKELEIDGFTYLLLGYGVLMSLKQDDDFSARKYLRQMSSATRQLNPRQEAFYHYCAAWEALHREEPSAACLHADQCSRLSQRCADPPIQILTCLLTANMLAQTNKLTEAMEDIEKARMKGRELKDEFVEFICLLNKAYLYLQERYESSAVELIREGMSLGRIKGFVNPFMFPKEALRAVVSKAFEQGIEENYVRGLTRKNNLLPDISRLDDRRWPWPFKIFTFGRFSVLKDNEQIHFAGRLQQKPLTMLKAIIAGGGRDINKDWLGDQIWPETEGSKSRSSLSTTLSRLRNLIGMEEVLVSQEKKITLNARVCWVDLWAFERLVGEAELLRAQGTSNGNRKKEIDLLERAINMYTGPFLANDNEPWLISMRERTRSKFLRVLRRLGMYLEESEELEKAVEYCERGLEVDSVVEEFYQRIMRCYLLMDRRAEALNTFNRCKRVLSNVLEIEPSHTTLALRDEIIRGKGQL